MADQERALDERILEFLKKNGPETFTSTKDISKAVLGSGSTKKMINPTLYKLLRENMIRKVCNEDLSNPRYSCLETVV